MKLYRVSTLRSLCKLVCGVLVGLALFTPSNLFAQTETAGITNTFVKIINADTSRFPLVELDFAILNKQGLLKTPVTAADIGLIENSVPISNDFLTLDYLNNVPLAVSIVIDTTTSTEQLEDLSTLAEEVVSSLTAADQVEVLTIGNGVDTVAEFTDATTFDFAILDELEPVSASLNFSLTGVADAIKHLEAQTAQKRTVFLLTDNQIEEGTVSLSTLARSSRVANTSVYVFGLGAADELDSLAGISKSTGGATYLNTAVDGLSAQAATLLSTMRSAYRVSYVSSHDLPNDLAIEITHDVTDGTVAASTTAPVVSTRIGLGLPVIPEDGVSGVFKFATQSNGEAPIEKVQIYIDGALQETLYQAPFVYQVNTSLFELGDHTFTAIAEDSDGNYGRIDSPIRFIQTPVTSARFVQSRYELGPNQAIDLSLDYDENDEIETVAFFINEELLQLFDAPPYSAQLTTEMLAQGEYELTAVIVDSLGRETRAYSRIEHITSVFQQRLVQLSLAAGAMILTALLSFLAVNMIFKRQRRIVQKPFALAIANNSNVKSRYAVFVEDVGSALRIKTFLNGQALPLVSEEFKLSAVAPAPVAVEQRPDPVVDVVEETTTTASKTERASAMNKSVGRFASTLASLLPKSLSAPFRSIAATSRKVSNTERKVQTTSAKIEKLQGKQPTAANTRHSDRTTPKAAAPAALTRGAAQRPTAAQNVWANYSNWLVTPELAPGEEISLTLQMSRRKRVKDDQYGVRVSSIPLTKSPSERQEKVNTFKAMIPSVPLSIRLLPVIIVLLAVLLFLVALRYFLYLL